MGKNIVIFADGTSMKGGEGHNSNVYKLFNMVENRTSKQVVFYDPGLGTGFRKLSGTLFGSGFSRNIIDCYKEIHRIYEAGDEIFLFGFSRGAATVRSLSGFIDQFGILPRSRPDLIKKAYKIYKTARRDKMERRAKEFIKKHHTMWTRIRFLGVWDTVAALGIPYRGLDLLLDRFFRHRFHSFELSPGVDFARHAIAIDDERKTFHPVLWDQLSQAARPWQNMKQVWFCGSHTDVGGGYAECGLSNIALTWMVHEAAQAGLRIYPGAPILEEINPASACNVEGVMHNPSKGLVGSLFRRKKRDWDHDRNGPLIVHESVLQRRRNRDNTEAPVYVPDILQGLAETDYYVESWERKRSLAAVAAEPH